MKLLVTGGCGFIGSNYIRNILEGDSRGEVYNLDNLSYGSNPANLKGIDRRRYTFVEGDITDAALVARLISKVDAVINFAAESHVDRSIANPFPFFRSNVGGVLTLLEALRTSKRRVRMLHVSTDEVYGSVAKGSVKEIGETKPSSPYAASKAAGDAYCLAYNRTYGVDVVVSRSTNNYGPFQFPEKLIPKTIIRAKSGLRVPVYGSGRQCRDWLYVGDNCAALSLILENGASGEVYNVAGESVVSNIRMVSRILSLMGKSKGMIQHVEDRPGHDSRYSLDCGKLKRDLGWRRKRTFEKALAETVEWYLANEEWWKPVSTRTVLSPTPWKNARV